MKTLWFFTLSFLLTLPTFSQTPEYVPTNGLIGWWGFNGTVTDESGNGNHGANFGATPALDRFGIVDKAYAFNGSSSYIEIADAAPLRLSNTDYTISFWVNLETYSTGGGTAFVYKRGIGSQNGWAIGADQGTQNLLMLITSQGIDPRGYSSTTLSFNDWHNVTVVYTLENGELKFYIDGELNSTTFGVDSNYNPVNGIPTPNPDCNSIMRFGQDTQNNNYSLNGKLDDIGIWNRALTIDEITELYLSCSDPVVCAADINDDGGVNVVDVLILLGAFGACCQ